MIMVHQGAAGVISAHDVHRMKGLGGKYMDTNTKIQS